MKKFSLSHGMRLACVLATLCILLSCLGMVPVEVHAQPTGYQEYYVLGYEEQVWQAFKVIYGGDEQNIPGSICSTVSLVATADYQVVYYDHWEDGYEADLLHPVQETTRVYGDGNPGNGSIGASDILRAGDDVNLTSDQNLPNFMDLNGYVPVSSGRDPRYVRYDGGDRILTSGGPVNLTHAIWPFRNTWVGGAWELYSRSAYENAYAYRLPIGEDLYLFDRDTYGDFEKVYLQLVAFKDGTTVSIDNGTDVVNLFLDRGQTYSSMGYVNSSPAPSLVINAGTVIRSDGPVQVGLITGKVGPPDFQTRFLVFLPSRLWGADYVVPVPSGGVGDWAEIYLFNPNDFEITVHAYDLEAQSTFVLSPTTFVTSTVAYSSERGGTYVREGSAARFTSPDGVFGIVVCADTTDTTYDWGFSGIPAKYLTQDYYVSWAPGTTDLLNNGSPVWVTPLYDGTTFYVDYNEEPGGLDGVVDRIFPLDVLEQERIFDPDNDNTGMHVWATGKFAIAWGSDPGASGESDPYLDLGVTVLPALERWLDPVLTFDKTANPTILPPEGGTVTFTLVTRSHKPLLRDVSITDTLPISWTYVPDSTHITYPGGGTGGLEPTFDGQTLSWGLDANLGLQESLTLTFQAQITDTEEMTVSVNQGEAVGEYFGALFNPSDEAAVYVSFLDLVKSVNHVRASVGDTITYTLSYANTSPSITATNVSLRDIAPIQHVTFQSASHGGSYDGAKGAVTWMLGTLAPGERGQVTFAAEVNDFVRDATVIENMAYIDSDQTAEAGSNIVRTIVPAPDVVLSKSGPSYAYRGDVITYNLTYANVGGIEATEVVVWDTIPLSTTLVPGSLAIHTGSGWTVLSEADDGDQGTFVSPTVVITPGVTPGVVAPGESGRIRFSVELDDDLPSGWLALNSATLGRRLDVPSDSNLVVTTLSDLLIAKAAEQEVAAPGSAISYTLTYGNLSPTIPQTEVYVQEAIPDHTRLIPGTVYGGDRIEYSWDNGATYEITWPITPVTHLRWYDAQVPTDTQRTVGFAVRVNDALPPNADIQNTAYISSAETAASIREWIPSNQVKVGTVNLWVEKSASRSTVEPGDSITYTIECRNRGNVDAPNIVIADWIPANTTLIPGSVTGGGSTDGRVITWTTDLVARSPIFSANFAVVVNDPLPASVDVISNTVWITSGQGFTVGDVVTTTVTAAPDLTVVKNASAPFVQEGQILTYTITFANVGTQEATGLVVVDTLSDYTTFIDASDGGIEADGVVTWTLAVLQVGDSLTRSIVVAVNDPLPIDVKVITNTVVVADDGSNGPDPTPGNNVYDHTTFIGAAPDLVIDKSSDGPSVVPGDVLTYTLTLSNLGNEDATGVVVTDTLPDHTTFAGASGGGAEVDGTVTWDIESLDIGATVTRTVVVTVNDLLPVGVDTLTNTAVISDDSSHGADLLPGNNSCTHIIGVEAAPDLVITKTSDVPAVAPGDVLTYTLLISNKGNQGAAGVVITDTLPDHVVFAGASGGGVEAGGIVAWTIGVLGAGDSLTRTVAITLNDPLPAGVDVLTNVALVADDGSNGADLVPGDNVDIHTTPVHAVPDLVIVKTSELSVVAPGDVLAYTLNISNVGDQDATGVVVTDTLPDHTLFVDASDGGVEADGVVTWTIGSLEAGDFLVRTVVVEIVDPLPAGVGAITNTVRISDDGTNGPDPTPGNNVSTLKTDVKAAPDLSIVKTVGVPYAVPGDVLTYTLTIDNVGTQGAAGVVVTDRLPNYTTFAGASDEGAKAAPGSGIVTWPAFALAAGASVTRTVMATVNDPLAVGVDAITNVAAVADDGSNGPDPDPGNNTYTLTTAIDAAPDLVIFKIDDVSFAAPGDVLTYTLTISNVGNQDATGVVVTDELPDYTSFVGASHGSVEENGVATWSIVTLCVGVSVTRTVTIQVDDPFPDGVDRIINIASVADDGSNGVDLAPGDNTRAHVTIVSAAPDLGIVKASDSLAILAGQALTYTITIFNTGNQGATGVEIIDILPDHTLFASASDDGTEVDGSVTWTIDSVDVGQDITRTLVVTIHDPLPDDLEVISNVVTVTDDGTNGLDPVPVNNVFTHTIQVAHSPALHMVKEGPETAKVGDRAVFTFTVTHDTVIGDGSPVASVVVSDSHAGQATYVGGDGGDGWLEVGESWVYVASYVIDRNDPTPLVNVGTVAGRDRDGDLITDTAAHQTAIQYAPNLNIIKEGPPVARVGQRAVFTFTVATVSFGPTSVGPNIEGDGSPVRVVSVIDDRTGVATYVHGDDGDGWLEFGEAWVYTASYIVQEDDLSPLVNRATVRGEDRAGNPVEATDTHSIVIEKGTVLFFPFVIRK